jgi:hypothetical protein
MRSRFILGIVGVLAVLLFSACPNQLMRDLVEQKLASPTAGLFQINLGAAGTAVQSVTLRSQVSKNNDALEMRFKNESGDWSGWQKYSDSAGWTLTPGDNGSLGALKTVYAEFRDEGHHVVSLQDSIVYCAAVPNGNFFVWGTGTQAGQLHTQINTINSSLYISVADAVDMRFNNDGGAWSAWMPYSTTAAWPLQAIDGARTVNAEFRNAGGSNVLTPNYTINLDTIAPTFGAPLSINGAAPVSYSATVSLTYTTPDGIWVEYQNDGGAWTAREAIASPRTWTLNASAGSRTVGIRITDVAGNQTVGAPASINLVTAAPAPSTVSPTAALRPTWTWPAFSGATTYRMQMDSTAGAWTVIGNVTSYTPGSDLSVGMHTLYLQAQDPAGNWSAIGSSPVTIDLSAPGAPTLTVTSPTNDNTPTWSWLALPDTASYLYQLDTTTGTWTEVPSSTLSFTPGSPLSDGQHTLFLQAKKNLTGTLSPMASATTRIDTTAPAAPNTPSSPAFADGFINIVENTAGISVIVAFGGSGAVVGDTLILRLNGSPLQNRVLTSADVAMGYYVFAVAPGSVGADGTKNFTANIVDAVGNSGPLSALIAVLLDTVSPTVALGCNDPDLIVQTGQSVTYTAIFSEPVFNPTISIGSLVSSAPMVGSGTTWTYDWTVPGGFSGTVSVVVNATDAAGNPNGAPTGATSLTIITTPSVSTYAPDNIHATYAFGYGSVSSDGGAPVTERGLCWSVNPSPTIADAHIASGSGTGMFTATISGLTLGTTYYVRAYATNSVGTAYYNQITFQTLFDLVLGETFGGGVIFTISGTYPNQHGKVATVHDSIQTVYILWSVSTGTTGATSTTDGAANTALIYSNQGTSGAVYAARYCEEYTGGGYSDWYLPAQDELALLWTNRAGIIGSSGYWWSSTETGTTTARVIYWPDGSQTTMSKTGNNCWVCPIRAF